MAELRFAAMGTTAHVIVEGGDSGLVEMARRRVADLEARWSRFRPDSEIATLNRAGWAWIGPETTGLIERAVSGWERTGGRFDPTVHRAMESLGYDRDFSSVAAGTVSEEITGAAPGCVGIQVTAGMAQLPSGVGFDPGGIGKGYAADLVAEELLAAGATAALVNLGGDLRGAGLPEAGGWGIRVSEPAAGVDVTLGFSAGAVATSTPLRRRWSGGSAPRHHLLDPGTGLPTETTAPVLVSVVAGEGWWAEVCTKAAMLTPPALLSGLLDEAAALVVHPDLTRSTFNRMEDYLQ